MDIHITKLPFLIIVITITTILWDTMPPISIMKSPASAATDILSPPPTTAEHAPSPVTSHHLFFSFVSIPCHTKLVGVGRLISMCRPFR